MKRKDLLKIATTDSSPANDGQGGICGGVLIDGNTLFAIGMDKSDGSMHQNFMGKFTVRSFNDFCSVPIYIMQRILTNIPQMILIILSQIILLPIVFSCSNMM